MNHSTMNQNPLNKEIILNLVKATGVSAGELVLVHFWGEDEDKEIANHFVAAVAALGATPVLLQQSRTINRDIFLTAKDNCFDERYFALFSEFDTVLDVFTYQPIVLGAQLPDEQMALYRRYISQLFYKLMECKRFTQIRIPTQANAAESNLDPQDYIQRMTDAYDIDYEALKTACAKAIERFAGAERIVVYTGTDCVLYFELTGRTWHIDAGDGDLPCGEIYIAPVEYRTKGSVFFENFYLNEVKYSNITLQISDGEVVGSSNPDVWAYFTGLPRENRIVCELGIGMNPNVTDLCGYTVLDEKMAGTFHIAVGANDMFGGENKANDHIDFVGCGRMEVVV
ncbi:MAG: aminopeptidase [Lachnospiraceae bacterium]|nr:aminopeptidase [Lachnospiraceae bacterium]